MNYLNDLKTIVNINSYTKNKTGVDSVSKILDNWFIELGFTVKTHIRENIGNHKHYISPHCKDSKKLLLLGHIDTVFAPGKFENFSQDEEWIYGPGVCDMKGGIIV
ncbi:M20/M25/M40 family metallo-hydrolase, partial [Sulfurimonas sp.]